MKTLIMSMVVFASLCSAVVAQEAPAPQDTNQEIVLSREDVAKVAQGIVQLRNIMEEFNKTFEEELNKAEEAGVITENERLGI